MPIVVRAFPLKASRDEAEAFADELAGPRREDAANFYRSFGIKHESWHVQDTPAGTWVIVVSMLDEDPHAAGQRYAAASEDFHAWFKSNVMRITGVDANTDPLGPPTEPIFYWTDSSPTPLRMALV